MTQGQISDPKTALSFILAGKATVTLRSLVSGNRYTYKIVSAKKSDQYSTSAPTWFVKLLNGPDNATSFVYIGFIRNNQFVWTAKSHVGKDAPSVIGFTYVLDALVDNNMRGFEVWHEGKCGRCGKKLTVPESIATGFGPDCLELVGGGAVIMAPVVAAGAVTPQPNLNFDGSTRQPKVNGVAVMNDSPRSDKKFLAAFPTQEIGVGELDAMIRARIVTYKAEAPENFYQDGELDEKQAFNVAYNMHVPCEDREGQLIVKDLIEKLSAMDPNSGIEFEIPKRATPGDRYPVDLAQEVTYYSILPGKRCVIKCDCD